jgi:hypothetical protein
MPENQKIRHSFIFGNDIDTKNNHPGLFRPFLGYQLIPGSSKVTTHTRINVIQLQKEVTLFTDLRASKKSKPHTKLKLRNSLPPGTVLT